MSEKNDCKEHYPPSVDCGNDAEWFIVKDKIWSQACHGHLPLKDDSCTKAQMPV